MSSGVWSFRGSRNFQYDILKPMNKHTLSFLIVLLGVIVAILHGIAVAKSLYWIFPWFDVLMHFLGGALVSLFGVWVYKWTRKSELFVRTGHALLNVLLFVFIIGLFWETFEVFFDIMDVTRVEYWGDTLFDFIMNGIGGVFAFYLGRSILEKTDGT